MIRRSLLFTEEDEKIIKILKPKLAASHGADTITAIVRLGLRALLKVK